MKYKIGSLYFKTQKQAVTYCKALMQKHGFGDYRKGSELYGLFLNLLDNHHEKLEKVGCGIDYFSFIPNAINKKAFAVDIVRTDGSVIDFSWRKCAMNKTEMSHKDHMNLAMRDCIHHQILLFREISESKCKLCGAKDRQTHVDHVKPFKIIKDEFIKEHGLVNSFEPNPITNAPSFKKEDKEYSKKWSKYHQENATLQILCDKCNLSKGAK